MTQLVLFAPPPVAEQLTLALSYIRGGDSPSNVRIAVPPAPTKGQTMTTRRPTLLERIFPRRRKRFGGIDRPFPSSTTDLTPDDWRIIRLALETQIVDSTRREQWPKAEAAQRTRDKLGGNR